MPSKTLWKKNSTQESSLFTNMCMSQTLWQTGVPVHSNICSELLLLCNKKCCQVPVIPLLFTEFVTWSVVGVTLELNLANWLFPRRVLEKVFDEVILVNVLDSGDSAHLALMKRPELGVTLTKLHCWELTQFSKCVFMDADTMVSSCVSWYLLKT